MSTLYTDPKNLKKELGRNKTGNWFQDTFTDYVSSGLSVGDDGQVKREGAAWWLQGLTPGAEGIARKKDEIAEATAVRNAIISSGLDDETIKNIAGGRKLTTDNVTGILNKAAREYQTPTQKRESEVRIRQGESSINLAEQQQGFNQKQLEWQQQQAAENARNRWQDRQDQRREQALTRELNAQNNQMQMQLEYARLAQSDRQKARDRKDQAIMALIQGLGNLGTAFTI